MKYPRQFPAQTQLESVLTQLGIYFQFGIQRWDQNISCRLEFCESKKISAALSQKLGLRFWTAL